MVKTVVPILLFISTAITQQLSIPRVEQMPNYPMPYHMRDWKKVASGYDSLVFDLNRTGQYLPLIWINQNTINYPQHPSFGLHTYVGTRYPTNAEAINVLPAVIGASLVGIDKTNQFGYNWVLFCEEFFNRRPEENVYLNNPVTESGDDWWYATMPNVFFYQLYDLYPHTGDFAYQLRAVAEQWFLAVTAMGGKATPWTIPNMNYRGWYLSTMRPYSTGVAEPEAAGAIAWLLYHAYLATGEVKYRWGAEWALDFLNSLTVNPSYELQLPYGALVAARMNAELGTEYDIPRLVNWCFNPEENVRDWGVTLGRWGAYDCHGLVGEAKYDGYAFAMNTFQMAAALVPLVRYDNRFARAIGKWLLNLANAARLFYTDFLPDGNQDGAAWAHQYDPQSCLAHEALRQSYYGATPYATGDAVKGGWSATNYALYGSSHVGYLAAIVDTTDVPGILKLNLRATDFFQPDAYPSFLFYNPYPQVRQVSWDVGSRPVDIYEATNNEFIQRGVTGTISLTIPPDAALLTVLIPAERNASYQAGKLMVDGIVIDYSANGAGYDHQPRIRALAAMAADVLAGDTVRIYCTATDYERGRLYYTWYEGSKQLPDSLPLLEWIAPPADSLFTIYCACSDGINPAVRDSVQIKVHSTINQIPQISGLECSVRKLDPGDSVAITCCAFDNDGDRLQYVWSATAGNLVGNGEEVIWVAPLTSGFYWVRCCVTDGRGGWAQDSLSFQVRDLSLPQIGDPVLYLPFCRSSEDFSGLRNHGEAHNVLPCVDRHGITDMAYDFDGSTSYIQVPANASLNFRDAISVSLWIKPTQLFTNRETYPLSHGNWENRWKISITPAQRVRWTVKTTAGIRDLDSKVTISAQQWYHIVAVYDGADLRLYINGQLDNRATFQGKILTTDIDLMVGQVLPGNSQYNFKGVIDDIRLYDYTLDSILIDRLYHETSDIALDYAPLPRQLMLHPNFPNPFNPTTVLRWDLPEDGWTQLAVFDLRGELVAILVQKHLPAGCYSYVWDASSLSSGIYFLRLQQGKRVLTRKCLKLK